MRTLVLVFASVLAFACNEAPAGPPEWPALEGAVPSHGIEQLELRGQNPDADEEDHFRIVLRRDGCVRRETTVSDGSAAETVACTGCSDDREAVDRLFADVKSREVVTVLAKMGKALAPPIALGQYQGYLFMDMARGQTRRGSGGDPVIERVARQLHEGVPGMPELDGDRCAVVEGEGE